METRMLGRLEWVMVLVLLTATISGINISPAGAEIPKLINYQGLLINDTGVPVNGTFSIQYSIYDVDSGPNPPLWFELQNVTTQNGIYNVLLGSATPIPDNLFRDPNRYLGVKVGIDPEMVPRQRFTSVPYAFNAGSASTGQPGVGTEMHIDRGYFALQTPFGIYWRGNRELTTIDISPYVPSEATAVYLRLHFTVRRPYNSGVTHVAKFVVMNGEANHWSERALYQGSNGSQQGDDYDTWIPLGPQRALKWRVDWADDSVTEWTCAIMVQGYLK